MTKPNLHTPIVIGGTGGSGTRLVQQIFATNGYFMGANLNPMCDTMDFEPFLEQFINPILAHTGTLNYRLEELPVRLRQAALQDLKKRLDRHIGHIPADAPGWGWKNPRMIYVLPLVQALFPAMRFIHVVRDGRDMTLSKNQNQRRKHYISLFRAMPNNVGPLLATIRLWQKTNLETAAFCERAKIDYHCVRYEDLCRNKANLTAFCTGFALKNIPFDDIHKELTIGRYRQLSENQRQLLTSEAMEALRHFHYL